MRGTRRWAALTLLCAFIASGCTGSYPRFTAKEGRASRDPSSHQLAGIASYYADEFNGRRTSNGETYDMNALTAAHRTLPFNTKLRVTNLGNGRSTIVRVNDRGPFKDDRVIDLSLAAAKQIGLIARGTSEVRLEVVEMGEP
jgi:rare lipoprotein A